MTSPSSDRAFGGIRISGDPLPWVPAGTRSLSLAEGCAASAVVCGVDLRARVRPAAERSMLRQRVIALQLELCAADALRRALVVVGVRDRDQGRHLARRLRAAGESVHRTVEMMRGRPLSIALLVIPAGTDPAAVTRRVLIEATRIPDGVCVLEWEDVERWGARAAAALAVV